MKKTDIALLILIVALSGLITYFIANALLGSQKQLTAKVTEVQPVKSSIVMPEESVFNANAINPAIQIKIGDSSNQQPF